MLVVFQSVIQLDKKVLAGWSLNKTEYANVTSLLKVCHGKAKELGAPIAGQATDR